MNKFSQWQFSKIPNIEESNFNKILERFYSLGVAGLTRENIQNSLDGRVPETDEPVIVKIELGTVNRQAIPGMDSKSIYANDSPLSSCESLTWKDEKSKRG